jgi:hypothetical protein
MGEECSTYSGVVYKTLVGIHEGTRPRGKPRHRWEDNIEMPVQGMRLGHGMD